MTDEKPVENGNALPPYWQARHVARSRLKARDKARMLAESAWTVKARAAAFDALVPLIERDPAVRLLWLWEVYERIEGRAMAQAGVFG